QVVLLDFGAARPVAPETAAAYRTLLAAGLANDRDRVRQAAVDAGFINQVAVDRHRALIDEMIDIILAEANRPGPFDFANRDFLAAVRE
ncbi:hypothetical protein ABTK22_19325, partial [Acinetobacter baumannii]